MNRALYAAASGMAAQQENLDVIAGNLANANVAGFKGVAERFAAVAAERGEALGTTTLGALPIFTQGKIVHSGSAFDVAIQGDGFFTVMDGRGRIAYTRNGEFSRDAHGQLRNADGWHLCGVRIPADAISVQADAAGLVTAKTAHGSHPCGRIRLAQFPAPEHLQSAGGTLFFATAQSGKASWVTAGKPDGPSIEFGAIEQSNVSIVEAMMEILAAQRAYEANAKGVQAADEMMRIADNLSRA